MRDQEGFTLVEILISMVILGILITSIGGALIVSLKTTNATRAVAAGLETRSLASTVADTLAWDRERSQEWPMAAGLTQEREAQLLTAWHAEA